MDGDFEDSGDDTGLNYQCHYFASLIIMSLFHVCIYKFDLMLHMLPEAHKNRGLQSTMQVFVHFCVTWNFFL